ncbi:immunoglobulin superfamily member 1-like [Terrapene carolina triunguis]|uniref:immunoglobulin superfamily member 1-like n=1 Tax=Terrapene triunguis TaxID=2587831 RepID=UPI001156AB0C|nr:immunoglobulin superfamily member 1-like [Terrapene carolina triunguis]
MASALSILFLGQEYPKPTISVSPSRVVALGGTVTIRCEGLYLDMEFFLRKTGQPNPQRQTVPDGTMAEFPIPSVSREDGGSYTCDYRSIADQSRTSHPSDPVEIIVGEPTLPKPSVSVRPIAGVSLGGAVAIWCRGQRQGMRFVLNTDGRHFPPVDSGDFETVFPISNVSREDGGSYSCSYHNRLEPIAVSYPSDPMELVVGDPSLPRPSISLSPTGVTTPGANVTIRCQGQRRNVTFFLHKPRDRNPQRHVDPAGDWAEFLITTMGRQQGGSYSCSYRPRSEPFVSSEPSDPVQLVVAEPSLPRPSISLSPTGVTAPGADVTIRCQGQRRDVRFFLHKAGDSNPQRHMDPAGAGAEFRIPTMGRQHGGSYSCSYQPQSESFVFSEPSDPVELVGLLSRPLPTPLDAQHSMGSCAGWGPVAGSLCQPLPARGLRLTACLLLLPEPTLRKPIISPSGEVSLGGTVSIWCWGQGQGVRIVLNKGGRHVAHVDSEKSEFVFPINNVRREQGGNYSCSHHSRSEPFVRWSDPVELVVRG